MSKRSVVLLASDCASTRFVLSALQAGLGDEVNLEIIIESPVPTSTLLLRRVKRLGALRVFGQILFMASVYQILRRVGRRRLHDICKTYGISEAVFPSSAHHVGSANSSTVEELLRTLAPAVVIVNGTRILSKKTLNAVNAPFINMHAGITPQFRGVHGGYWALATGRPDLVGTTIHRVDEGIDTGLIIEQVPFTVTAEDTFYTYPTLHTAVGLPALLSAVRATLSQSLQYQTALGEQTSVLRTHPTLWQYFLNFVRNGAR